MSTAARQSLMDELLRGAVPEIKLGLGEAIDRENARPLPPRYARLLPETLLVVTLRPDAADALEPIAADLERELTDSCTRHGSLYDRAYRVRLQRSGDRDAPLYVVSTHAGKDIGGEGGLQRAEHSGTPDVQADAAAAREPDGPGRASASQSRPDSPASATEGVWSAASARARAPASEGVWSAASVPAEKTAPKPAPATPRRTTDPAAPVQSPGRDPVAASRGRQLPFSEAEVTRDPGRVDQGWHPGRWVLVVESADGEESEVFRLSEPLLTIGRRTDDPSLRAAIAISDAPNVSRRQLALEWEDRDGAAGFRVYNLGLNTLYIPGRDIPGSRSGKMTTALDRVGEEFTGWLPPGVSMRIGDQGPTLRIEEVPVSEDDYRDDEATVYE